MGTIIIPDVETEALMCEVTLLEVPGLVSGSATLYSWLWETSESLLCALYYKATKGSHFWEMEI